MIVKGRKGQRWPKTTILLLLLLVLLWTHGVDAFGSSGRHHHYNNRPVHSTVLFATIHPDIQRLMEQHDPILLFVSQLLPAQKAADAAALYAWCRRLDEITDREGGNLDCIRRDLEEWDTRWEQILRAATGGPTAASSLDSMDLALVECLQRHPALGPRPFLDMMAGMKADTTKHRRMATLVELEDYGYQVAGTVGLMLLPLLMEESNTHVAQEPAIALGTAIQLINILRDTAPDAVQLGRIYLPQSLLKEEGIADTEILNLRASEGYCRVVKTVADRAEALLQQAETGKFCLPGVGPLLVQIIVELYRGYLEQLAVMDYDNLSVDGGERVRISTMRKIKATATAVGAILRGK